MWVWVSVGLHADVFIADSLGWILLWVLEVCRCGVIVSVGDCAYLKWMQS